MAHPSFSFFIACTQVNAYLAVKYFLNTDDSFMILRKMLDNVLIKKSYMNEKTRGSTAISIKIQTSHTLETAPTHNTELKRRFSQQNINTNSTSIFVHIVKKLDSNLLLMWYWNVAIQIESPYACFGKNYRQSCD